ncbi:MAG TPA: AAA family ATPase, partial [Longimicrobiaceae bacterium]|nr:AAA family ATPase [Longimicrobiaceae bacterium]
MLRLRRLEIEDFGPYKGIQEFRLSDADGVMVVYGENRRGKTSLLNAIRFALLGQVVTRGSRPLQFQKVLNTVARAEGCSGFRVALDFTFGGHAYALTRRADLRAGATEPLRHDDFKPRLFLTRDGQA